MPLAIGPVHLRTQSGLPTVSVGVHLDGDFGLSQGRDSVVMDAEQQGQLASFMRKHLPHLFQPSSETKET